ncbi:MAG: dihydroneopterin aldolase [Candidatus Cryptobacteroides sp.]
MRGKLELKGMKFHARHGCLDFEKEKGGEYLVDFEAELELGQAAISDELKDTIDYSEIYALICKEMEKPSNLIENVASRIFKALEEAYPELEHFSIRLSKLDPPVGGEVNRAVIHLSR